MSGWLTSVFAISRARLLIGGMCIALAGCGGSDSGQALRDLIAKIQQQATAKKFPDGAYVEKVVVSRGRFTEEGGSLLRKAIGASKRIDAGFLDDLNDSYGETVSPPPSARGAALTLYVSVSFQASRSVQIYPTTYVAPEHYLLAMIAHDERGGEIAFEGYRTVKAALGVGAEEIWEAAVDYLNAYGIALAAQPNAVTTSMNPNDFPGVVRLENTNLRRQIENLRRTGSRFAPRVDNGGDEDPAARRAVVADKGALRRIEGRLARSENRTAPANVRNPLWLSSFGSRNAALFHLSFLERHHGDVFSAYPGEVRETGLADPDRQWAVVFTGVRAADLRRVCAAIEQNEATCRETPG